MNRIYGTDGNVYETSISNGKEYMSSKKEKENSQIDMNGNECKCDTCDDVISKQAVLDILTKYHLEMSKIAEDVNKLPPVKLVRNTITKEEAIQWIPTSERQPEHTGDYLVTMGINYDGAGMFDCIRVASYNTCFGWSLYEKNDAHTLFGEITAWAKLPKKYS